MKSVILSVVIAWVLVLHPSCTWQKQSQPRNEATPAAPTTAERASVAWPDDPTGPFFALPRDERLTRAWDEFQRSQKYRVARPEERQLTPAAVSRVNTNNPNQVIPFLRWWGVQGLTKSPDTDVLVAIVVDPEVPGPNRYGLVVLASPAAERGGGYKAYWVARGKDMESWLISPASGSVYIECFGRDGVNETKQLTWDAKTKQFTLA